ncbi:MAG TPA: beta-ketoacyl-ACP synthase II [Acetomicrobium flavidum]|uniref:3-oxoacyl-[acyl-carrier-protein] synthase 2 n=1 Tax=Acetomicrobium flavidum TaxID=49896 RepID=A0ABY1JBK9_9BACT|nr:beta-ketoacyl-ACP synthase II [Acetomicrobium flavidum]SIN63831.1 3-oxoacyl-[acyl-carrier-protein] synthase II [Acetomicrobium flavidum]HOJ81689.1 beta-ketoacyl-ACP synthase II [Acetomicrobium flavidum]HOM30731.1 beta-ketoacyl-ACP synthase II [Acetomicrobium flavidum]HOP87234.1 beta-ketoacyl-ACP synthase II [Acetomicrobium flavidum]
MRRVVITGIGVVSPIGNGKEEYWKALEEGKNGVGPITLFDVSEYPVRIAAEVKDFDPGQWMDRKEVRKTDRVIHFAVAASDMAIEDGALDLNGEDPTRVGVYLGSGEGGIGTSFQNIKTLLEKGPNKISPFFIPMMISNMPAAYVAIRHNAKGPSLCAVTACATATHTIGEAIYSIRRGEADVILAGGAEAAITPIGVAGFAAMKALSSRNDDPEHASRPFDADRDGFVLGEGAGVLILEELEHAKRRNAKIYAELVGYGNTTDAYHITAPDPEGVGAVRAMSMAVSMAGWDLADVELINAHGTSTPLNDAMEAKAIRALFGQHTDNILVHSTKSMIGHGLGAAGVLELIALLLAFERGVIHPTINLERQDEECPINVVGREPVYRKISRALSNNFGFGGHNAVLAIQRYEG